MPLYRVNKEKIPCPHCGIENYIPLFDFVQWFNDHRNMTQLLEGKINTFECRNCRKIGWANKVITVHLYDNAKVYYKPVYPDAAPSDKDEMGAACFCEPAGKPALLLKTFIDEYEKKWEEKKKKDPKSEILDILHLLD